MLEKHTPHETKPENSPNPHGSMQKKHIFATKEYECPRRIFPDPQSPLLGK